MIHEVVRNVNLLDVLANQFECKGCGKCCSYPCICDFFNMADNECMIYDVRPDYCRNYPFLAFKNHQTSIEGMFVCPEAEKLIRGYLVASQGIPKGKPGRLI
jgi:hypothetical protein